MKTILLFALLFALLAIIIILFITLKKDKKEDENTKALRELTEVLKKMQNEPQKYRSDNIDDVNLKLSDELIEKCKKITGNYRACTTNSKMIELQYYVLDAIMKKIDKPIEATTLFLEYLLCIAQNNACTLFYDDNGLVSALSIYKNRDGSGGLESENTIIGRIMNTNRPFSDNAMIIKYAKPYYDILKNNFENGVYTDNTKIPINTFISIIMANLSFKLNDNTGCNEDIINT